MHFALQIIATAIALGVWIGTGNHSTAGSFLIGKEV